MQRTQHAQHAQLPPDYPSRRTRGDGRGGPRRIVRQLTGTSVFVDLLAVAIAAAAAVYLLAAPGFPQTHDGEFHLFRLLDFHVLLQQGHWYPRWAPTMAAGYGYPVYNFYPPLSLWVAAMFRSAGLGAVDALKAAFAASVFVAGWAMYGFVRGDHGRAGAILAGIAYAALPYLLVDVYIRGALAESWGLALLPLVLAASRRLAVQQTVNAGIILGVALSLLLLTHTLTSLCVVPFVFLSSLVYPSNSTFKRTPWRKIGLLALAASIGLALSAIHWLPSLGEISLVSSSVLITGFSDYRRNFTPAVELVERTLLYDYQTIGFHAGIVQIAAAMLGSALSVVVGRARRSVLCFLCMLIFSLAMQVEWSAPLWAQIPLLAYLQFPWRWLTLTGIASAYLTGALGGTLFSLVTYATNPLQTPTIGDAQIEGTVFDVHHMRLTRVARLLVAVVVLGAIASLVVATAVLPLSKLIVTSGRGLEPPIWTARDDVVSTTTMQQMERHRSSVAATTIGEYLPRTGGLHPVTSVHRPVNEDPVPRPVRFTVEAASADRLVLITESAEPGPVILDQLYFPGWQAQVDGVSVPVTSFGALKLAVVEVPAGRHRVEFIRGLTALETVATVISVATAAVLGLVFVLSGLKLLVRRCHPAWRPLLLGVLVLAGLIVVTWPPRLSEVNGPTAAFENGAQLAGWRWHPVQQLSSTGIATIELFWTTIRPLSADFTVALRVLDRTGQVVGRRDQLPSHGLRPPRLWSPGLLVRDEQHLRLFPGVPEGQYRLVASIRVGRSWVPVGDGPKVSWREPNGEEVVGVSMGEVALDAARPRQAPDLQHPAGIVFGDAIELASWEVEGPTASSPDRLSDVTPGDILRIRLKWRSVADTADYAVFNHLHDHAFRLLSQADERPHRGYAATALLHRGDEVLDEYSVPIPRTAAPGRYTLSVGLYRRLDITNVAITSGPAAGDRYVLGVVKVVPTGQVVPEEAAGFRRVEATFGERAKLRGVVVEEPERFEAGKPLRVRLYWEAIGGPWPDATVFVHLVDREGKLVAQHDGPPSGGGYPLSIWSDGDVVVDQHEIVVPEGVSGDGVRLAVGLYDPQTGARYTRDDGGDAVTVLLEER